MNGYSYSDIQSMQKKAMERVREMKRTSEQVAKTAQRELGSEREMTKTDNFRINNGTRVTNMPPNFPKSNTYPDFNEFFQKENEKAAAQPQKQSSENRLESLFREPDRALLLGLILLLKSENADKNLIMALTYILS